MVQILNRRMVENKKKGRELLKVRFFSKELIILI